MDQKLRIELGNIQGQPRETNISATKIATRDFQGMRPKHLLMFILYSFAHHCNIDQIVCVSTGAHANYLNATNMNFHSNYDLLWEQLGGQLTGSGFYLLPSRFAYCAGISQGRKHRSRRRRRTDLKSALFRNLENGLTTALLRVPSMQQCGHGLNATPADSCRHQGLIDVSDYPGETPVPWFKAG